MLPGGFIREEGRRTPNMILSETQPDEEGLVRFQVEEEEVETKQEDEGIML